MSSQLSPRPNLTTLPRSEASIFFTPPSVAFLKGTWHVTHSTLPMWKSYRNVHITYTPLPSTTNPTDGTTDVADIRLDDLVSYNSLNSDKVKTVHGVDTPGEGGAWDWRGKGWLVIASSHWEVLCHGTEKPDSSIQAETRAQEAGEGAVADVAVPAATQGEGNQWVVTYFTKSLFTPAGIDIYSRCAEGLKDQTVKDILEMLNGLEAPEMKKLAEEMFEVKRDHCWLDSCKHS
ncbi:hypothetical protein V1506DRAFT_495357 [Lipomyces tetrasporus]